MCEKQAIDAYLKIQTGMEQTLDSDSEYEQLLSSYFKPVSHDLRQWGRKSMKESLSAMRILRKLERFIFYNVPGNSSQEGLGTITSKKVLPGAN